MSELKKRIVIMKGDGEHEIETELDGECCSDSGHFMRRYQTKAEQIATLEAYLNELKMEVQAVEEHLADLTR